MRATLLFSVIATLFSTHALSFEFQNLPPKPTGNENVLIIISSKADGGNTFLYSICMQEDKGDISITKANYEETMDFIKTLRCDEETREKENSRS